MITDEMMTRAFAAWSTAIANGEPGIRPAIEAALPLIRGAVVEECAKVAEYRDPGNPFAPRDDKGQRIAAAIRALSPREAGE